MLEVIASHATLAVVLLIGAAVFAVLTPKEETTLESGAPTPCALEGRTSETQLPSKETNHD